jgi:hypothetical protein
VLLSGCCGCDLTAQDISRQPKLTAGTVEQLADITTLTDPLVVDVLVKENVGVLLAKSSIRCLLPLGIPKVLSKLELRADERYFDSCYI